MFLSSFTAKFRALGEWLLSMLDWVPLDNCDDSAEHWNSSMSMKGGKSSCSSSDCKGACEREQPMGLVAFTTRYHVNSNSKDLWMTLLDATGCMSEFSGCTSSWLVTCAMAATLNCLAQSLSAMVHSSWLFASSYHSLSGLMCLQKVAILLANQARQCIALVYIQWSMPGVAVGNDMVFNTTMHCFTYSELNLLSYKTDCCS